MYNTVIPDNKTLFKNRLKRNVLFSLLATLFVAFLLDAGYNLDKFESIFGGSEDSYSFAGRFVIYFTKLSIPLLAISFLVSTIVPYVESKFDKSLLDKVPDYVKFIFFLRQ